MFEIGNDEAFERQPHADGDGEVVRAGHRCRGVVLRDRAAQGDAAVGSHAVQRRLQMVAAHVVEVHVDALRCAGADLPFKVAVAIVEGVVET